MINLLKDKIGAKYCAWCHKTVEFENSLVILEVKTIPPNLFFFHIEHFKELLDCLKIYAKEKENGILDNFLRLNIDGLRDEKTAAEQLGIEYEFRKDLNEVVNIKIYDKLKEAIKRMFNCPVFEDIRSFEDCLECIDSNFFKFCSKRFVFSIKPDMQKYKKVMTEI
jgi:hypothetical protein